MKDTRFYELHETLHAERRAVMDIKGGEYPSGDGDRLSNFKTVGKLLSPLSGEGERFNARTGEWESAWVRLPLAPDVVAMIYKLKHVMSACTFVREGRRDEEGREPIIGRLSDDMNYDDLLYAIFEEQGRIAEGHGTSCLCSKCLVLDLEEPVTVDTTPVGQAQAIIMDEEQLEMLNTTTPTTELNCCHKCDMCKKTCTDLFP